MLFNNPLPRGQQPRFHESSGLRSIRDGDSTDKLWKKSKTDSWQVGALARALQRTDRIVQGLRRRILGGTPPQDTAALPKHPFQIYQPSNVSAFKTGIAFLGPGDGVATMCNIDATKPTDFTANPPTVNPSEAWRFWAVRSGTVEVRPTYKVPVAHFANNQYGDVVGDLGDNYALKYFVKNYTDGVSPHVTQAPFESSTDETVNPPLILSRAANGPNTFVFGFWLKITPDTATADVKVQLVAQVVYPDISGFIQSVPGDNTGNTIPVGYVYFAGSTEPEYIAHYLFDNVSGRFPSGNGNFSAVGGGKGGTMMNFRGVLNFQSGVTSPLDLTQQVFYPGDCIFINHFGALNNQSVIYMFTGDPKVWGNGLLDNNWLQIFGPSS